MAHQEKNAISNSNNNKKYYIYLCVHVPLVGVCGVPEEARREDCIPWSWKIGDCELPEKWVWGTQCSSSGRAALLLTAEPSFQNLQVNLKTVPNRT